MSRRLASYLASTHPGARIDRRQDAVAIVLEVDATWHACRIRTAPVAEVFVALPPLDGFELEVVRGDRWAGDIDVGDPDFDRAFLVRSNDAELSRAWLDRDSREAVRAAEFEVTSWTSPIGPTVGKRAWSFSIAGDRLTASSGRAIDDLGALDEALVAACRVAGFPSRLAAAFGRLGPGLGHAIPTDRVELGGRPVLRIERRGVHIALSLVRRSGRHERLRTVIQADRLLSTADRLAVVAAELPAAAVPAVPDLPRARASIDGLEVRASDPEVVDRRLDRAARSLVARCGPAAFLITGSASEIWFDGVVLDHARLDAAVELACSWALDTPAASGPYR